MANNGATTGVPPTTNTSTSTSHSLTIVVNGVAVGNIKSWKPGQSRTITPIFELNVATSGAPIDNIPGNLGSLKIQVERYDLYHRRMEQAFSSADLVMLSLQDTFFQVSEQWIFPDNSVTSFLYTGCWFDSLGRQYSSDGDRVVLVNASLTYLSKVKTSGPIS